jgi:hypothetical protein
VDLKLRPRSQLIRQDRLRPSPQPSRDVTAVDGEVVSVGVEAADDDVNVEVVRVPVIDRAPDQLPTEVSLHLAHEAAGKASQVDLDAIVRMTR